MDFYDHSMKTARECGSYRAIAGMMRDAILRLEAADADSVEAKFAMMSLVSLAQQYDNTVEKFEKEVDTV